MISLNIKHRICEYLPTYESHDTYEALKRVSKEWCYVALSFQWDHYNNDDGPAWEDFPDDKFADDSESGKLVHQMPEYATTGDHQRDFIKYGHKFVKSVGYSSNGPDLFDDDGNYLKCPNVKLVSINSDGWGPSDLTYFVQSNPTVTDVSMCFYHRDEEESDISELSCINIPQLHRLYIGGIIINIPSLSKFFDSGPNLKEIYIGGLYPYDSSDIVVNENDEDSKKALRQFPNVSKINFLEIHTTRTKKLEREYDQMVICYFRVFPNIETFEIKHHNFKPGKDYDPNRDRITFSRFELPHYLLQKLTTLKVQEIDLEMATNFQTNLPNIRELKINKIRNTESNDYYDVMQVFAKSFPQIERFELTPKYLGTKSDEFRYRLYDSLFFHQSDKTRQILKEKEWNVIAEEVDLSFATPIKFNWPNLRGLKINGNHSTKILLAFSQSKKLYENE